MKLSIVTTLYKSAPYIHEFCKRALSSALKVSEDTEIIFVNDGSPDNSLEIVLDLQKYNSQIVVIDLSRNFGHHKAVMTGLKYSSGDYVFLIDVDLEENPELLIEYFGVLENNKDADVVHGMLMRRKGGWFERLSGNLAYNIINYLSGEKMPVNYSFSRIMTRRYVKSLLEYTERELYIGGLWYLAGYKQLSIPIVKEHKGSTTYSLEKKISLLVTSIVSFSAKPLYLIFLTGSIIFSISVVILFSLLFRKLFYNYVFQGWTSIMVSLWFLGGLIILFIGIIGIYLSKVYSESKNRPYTTIRHIYKNE